MYLIILLKSLFDSNTAMTGIKDLTLGNFSSIYNIIMSYTGFQSLLLCNFGFNTRSVINILWYLNAISFATGFDVWHIITFSKTKNFADAMFQVAIMCHVTCLLVRIVTVFIYRQQIAFLIFIDYRDFNSNKHRPNSSLTALKESYIYLMKLDKFMKANYLLFMTAWYVMSAVISKSFLGFITGSNGYEEVLKALPTTLPGDAPSTFSHMLRWTFHIIVSLVFISIWATLDVLCFGVTVLLKKQYQILRNSLFYQTDEPSDDPYPLGLKPFVQDHVKLIRMTEILRDILSPIVGAQVLQTIFITACGTYLAATPTADSGKQLTGNLLAYAILSLAELCAFCWLSHVANTANEELGVGIYESSWYESIDLKKKEWGLSLMLTQKTIKYKAVGLMEINMETFLGVLQASYSYYTLMQAQT